MGEENIGSGGSVNFENQIRGRIKSQEELRGRTVYS